MAKKIVTPVEVQASVKGDESVKSFRAQLKEAQQEALRVAQALGQTSPQAQEAARRVAELKDQMDDFNATVAGMHPDKFEAVGKVVGTLANGFAAAQGAAALLGSESEDLQKAMVRVQGAMAFAQGIAGLKDIQFMFGGLKTIIMTQVVPALSTLRGALIATGIGAVAVAVGLLAANWDKATTALLNYLNLPNWGDLEAKNKKLVTDLERQAELTEAMGGTQQEVYEAQAKAIQVEMDLLTKKKLAKQATTEDEARLTDLSYRYAILGARNQQRILNEEQKAKDEAARKDKERADKAEADRKARKAKADAEAKQKAAEEERKKKEEQERREAGLREIAERDALVQRQFEEADKKREEERLAEEKRREEFLEQIERGKQMAREKRAENEKIRLKAMADYRKSIEDDVMASSNALIQMLGEQSGAAKAIALAQIAYDTGKAISGALAITQAPSADNLATGGLAGIAKYAAISAAIITNSARAIRIVKSGNVQQGGGGGNIGNMNAGRGVPQPSFTSSTLGGGTQFAGQFDNKVYVTEGDITGTQRRVRQNRGVSVI